MHRKPKAQVLAKLKTTVRLHLMQLEVAGGSELFALLGMQALVFWFGLCILRGLLLRSCGPLHAAAWSAAAVAAAQQIMFHNLT